MIKTRYVSKTKDNVVNETDDIILFDKPKSLFKYRTCCKRNIDSLRKGKIWLSKIDEFKDPVDSKIVIDLDKTYKDYNDNPDQMLKNNSRKITMMLCRQQNIEYNESININKYIKYFKKDGTLNKSGQLYLKINTNDKIFSRFKDFLSVLNKFLYQKNNIFNINDSICSSIVVYCMSRFNDIAKQWQDYSNGDNGFCIEYDLSKMPFVLQNAIYPIFYKEKESIDFFDLIILLIEMMIDNTKVDRNELEKIITSILTKDKSFESENEWRMILPNEKYNHGLFDFDYVKSIIIGYKVSNYYKKQLLDFAKEKNIKVFTRKLNKTKSKILIIEKI